MGRFGYYSKQIGQAPQGSAPPKTFRMLATYMRRMSNNLEIRIAGYSCRPQLYFV